jgi:hypothetical protein
MLMTLAVGTFLLLWFDVGLHLLTLLSKVKPPKPTPAHVHEAILSALIDAGLSPEFAAPSADLLRTGKLDDVIHHASLRLGLSIRTTQELETVLTKTLHG